MVKRRDYKLSKYLIKSFLFTFLVLALLKIVLKNVLQYPLGFFNPLWGNFIITIYKIDWILLVFAVVLSILFFFIMIRLIVNKKVSTAYVLMLGSIPSLPLIIPYLFGFIATIFGEVYLATWIYFMKDELFFIFILLQLKSFFELIFFHKYRLK